MAGARLIRAITVVGLLASTWISTPAQAGDVDLDALVEGIPACSDTAEHCFGVVLHIVVDDEGAAQSSDWLEAQLAEANKHFAPIGVSFEVSRVEAEDADHAHVDTRRHRDKLGRDDFSKGEVHVYIVRRLDNVDAEGEIYGVHWRDRKKRSRRWIIISARAWKTTLAHELGHFFGLPHSEYPISIMNKTSRTDPPPEQRTFAEEELEEMRSDRDAMLKSGMLEDR